MEYMKSLTVSGQTYQVKDPEALAVIPQTLTEAQQAQARKNLELWSWKETVDTLCPGFTVRDQVATCQPVKGYPLEVISYLEPAETPYTKVALTHCGKNLWRYEDLSDSYNLGSNAYITKLDTGVRSVTPVASAWMCVIARWLPIRVLDGKRITASVSIKASGENVGNFGIGYVSKNFSVRKTVEYLYQSGSISFLVDSNSAQAQGCEYIGFWFYANSGDKICAKGDYVDYTDLQVEIGEQATAYAPYQGNAMTVTLDPPVSGGSLDWTTGIFEEENGNRIALTSQQIVALPGINCLFGEGSDTQVTGRACPIAILNQLQKTVEA